MQWIFKEHFLQEKVTWQSYFAAVVLAVAASSAVLGLEHLTVEKFSNISGLLILSVLLSAMLLGRGPSIVNAAVCIFLYDWLMVPPFFSTANGTDNLIKFTVFITAALLTSWVASLARLNAIQLKRRERELMSAIGERDAYKREKQEEIVKRKAETLRNAILASVSHDLKTPIASIIGAMSSLKSYSHGMSDDDKDKLHASVLGEAKRLLGYIDNLLEVAKLEDKHTIIKRERVMVDDLLDRTLKRMASQLRKRRVAIRQADLQLAFRGDGHLMDIALGNILDNAVKFSPEGSEIIITVMEQPDRCRVLIQVEDEGVGISDQEAQLVFDKFYRARQADKKNSGTGLGLWIARRVVDAQGGMIQITGRSGGKQGVLVTMALPLDKA